MELCPNCNSDMVLRTARRGPNAGNQFWGCSGYPNCKGTRSYDEQSPDDPQSPPPDQQHSPEPRSDSPGDVAVDWQDGVSRPQWVATYTTVAALPTYLENCAEFRDPRIRKALGDTVIYRRRTGEISDLSPNRRFIPQIIKKLLQRGPAPLSTLNVEATSVVIAGLEKYAIDAKAETEVGKVASDTPLPIDTRGILATLVARPEPFELDPLLATHNRQNDGFDSPREVIFAKEIIPQIDSYLGHWLHAQSPFSQLAPGSDNQPDARRADFALVHPVYGKYIIEIDGEEHDTDARIDLERDDILSASGFRIVRIPNELIDLRDVTAIKDLLDLDTMQSAKASNKEDIAAANAATFCSRAAQLQFALAEAIEQGWLEPGGFWQIQLLGVDSSMICAVEDFIQMVRALDDIFCQDLSPQDWDVAFDEDASASHVNLIIRLEPDSGPLHTLTGDGESQPDIVIRPTYLPATLRIDLGYASERFFCPIDLDIADEEARLRDALTFFLRSIFRKRQFREGQFEAISNGLKGNDSVVLLPTGAGKSIIYQLTGLLQPGLTLVVDPLVSLIEDQERVLQEYGVERVLGITSGSFSGRGKRDNLLSQVRTGQYHFIMISPERLQTPDFREALLSLTRSTLINLAVIDEAHCVSEWGHDFRPAYLNLGRNLRRFGMDLHGDPPPLFALTGTASRAVLRDMLVDLEIDQNNSRALIRPHNFDRPELEFEIIKCKPNEVLPKLRGLLEAMPRRFNVSRSEFAASRGGHTLSGIVFCPTVKGARGIDKLRSTVSDALRTNVSVYSGSSPYDSDAREWDRQKREYADAFIYNRSPVIVSTKAFGMGIDKPNVRYVIHAGMPGSLEAYYQEAGRAGRDKKKAYCIAFLAESDEERTDIMVSPDSSDDQIERAMKSESWNARSDANTAMYFYRNGYPGVDEETSWLTSLLGEIGELNQSTTMTIPRGSSDTAAKQKEKAIFRLIQLKTISDYTVEYGAGKYNIEIEAFDPDKAKKSVLDYVQRSQPGRIKAAKTDLDNMSLDTSHKSIIKLAKYLTEFAYDIVARARRRAIGEAILAARIGSGNSASFRQRLLDYLEEGTGSAYVEALLDQDAIDLGDWFDIAEKIHNAAEAGEFRGIAIRYLESYPEHPGLLLLRALAEAMAPDGDTRICRENIESILTFGPIRYGLHSSDIIRMFHSMLDFCTARTGRLSIPLLLSFEDYATTDPELHSIYATAITNLMDTFPKETCHLKLAIDTDRLARSIQSITADTAKIHTLLPH